MEQLEDSIKRYLVELDRVDRVTTAVLPGRVEHLKEKIAQVKQQMQALGEIGWEMLFEAIDDRTSGTTTAPASAMSAAASWSCAAS